ncbi:MAG: STAS domain-containing protein [Oscillospiraceae bacterium]|nr:STAS domain-containing protein [Oscillospiraceae bacterium]
MEHNFQDEKLTIFLPVRIDSANAADTEMKLMDLVEDYEPKAVVMDAKDMQYICSAGLRIILNVKKKVPDTEVINASSVVYDIFKTTGFNIVLKISKAHRRTE